MTGVSEILKKYTTPGVPGTAEQEQIIRETSRELGSAWEDAMGALLYHLMMAQEMRCALERGLAKRWKE